MNSTQVQTVGTLLLYLYMCWNIDVQWSPFYLASKFSSLPPATS
jgi:hypothetical protein